MPEIVCCVPNSVVLMLLITMLAVKWPLLAIATARGVTVILVSGGHSTGGKS
jgi:succinate-acetate transporter protein